jgi:hypothetical protein
MLNFSTKGARFLLIIEGIKRGGVEERVVVVLMDV